MLSAERGELQTDGRRPTTPSPGPPRLKRTPAAVHPLPHGGEGKSREDRKSQQKCRNSKGRPLGRPRPGQAPALPLRPGLGLEVQDYLEPPIGLVVDLDRNPPQLTGSSKQNTEVSFGAGLLVVDLEL